MSWLPSKPEANDRLKNSQVDIKNNFTEMDTSFSVNHESIGSGADEGKHTFINLMKQTSDKTAGADEMTIFQRVPNNTGAFGPLQSIFIRRPSSATANTRNIPLTSGTNVMGVEFNAASGKHAYSFLGSGLCEKFGYIQFSDLGGTSGALGNNEQRNNTISLTIVGPDFLATKIVTASLTLCPQNQLSFGNLNTMVYVRWGATTNTNLAITIVNQTGAAMPANTRILYRVVGQVDLTNT